MKKFILLTFLFFAPITVFAQPAEDQMDRGRTPTAGRFEDGGPKFEERAKRLENLRDKLSDRFDVGQEEGGHGPKKSPGRAMGLIKSLIEGAKDPAEAVGLAAIGIKESYKRKGEPKGAIAYFEETLGKAKDQQIRNVLLLLIRQSYEEAGDVEKSIETSKKIVAENLK